MATGVKEADVWAAADALLHTGEQPTIERVRLHLGRGSPNTVGPHLKTWFRGLSERLVARQGSDSGIPEAVTRAVGQVWEVALTTARDEWVAAVALERAELAQIQVTLQTDRAALAQEHERLRAREADLQASTQAAHAQATAAETRLQSAEQQLKEDVQALKATNASLTEAQAQVATLQQELRTLHTAHQNVLAETQARHAAHERRWLGEIDEQRQALKKAQEALEQGRKAADTLAAQHQQVLNQARADTDIQRQRAGQAEAATQALTVQLEANSQTARAAQAHWESTTAQLATQIDVLRGQVQAKDRQMELLMQAVVHHPSAPPPAAVP
jgi:hypothetical protein